MRKRIAWMGPLNLSPDTTGDARGGLAGESVGAYCADQLLERLGEHFSLDLYYDGVTPYRDFPTFHYLSAAQRHAQHPYDLFVYQLEDAACADFVRMHLALIPGLVWFHDVLFTRHGPEPMKNSPWSAVLDRFKGSKDWIDHDHEYPARGALAERELSLAGIAAFSTPRAHCEGRAVLGQALGALCSAGKFSSFYLPLPVPELTAQPSTSLAGELRIAFCGTPRIEHRAHKILWALQRTPNLARIKFDWLVSDTEYAAAQSLLAEPGFDAAAARITLHSGRSASAWEKLVASCDLALHPLFSAFGHPGLYLAISQSLGVPTVVSRFGDTDYQADGVLFKVDSGAHESQSYQEIFEQVLNLGVSDRRKLGELGAIFALEQYSSAVVAQEFRDVIERSILAIAPVTDRWRVLEREARVEVLREARELTVRGDALMKSEYENLFGATFEEFGWR